MNEVLWAVFETSKCDTGPGGSCQNLLLSLRDKESLNHLSSKMEVHWLEGNLDIMLKDQIPALATYTSHTGNLTETDHD